MCSRFKTIPDSVRIESRLKGSMGERCEGGFATVHRSEYRGLRVAVKTVRLYVSSNLEERFSVRPSHHSPGYQFSFYHYRNFAERWLPGDTYDTRTSYRLSAWTLDETSL